MSSRTKKAFLTITEQAAQRIKYLINSQNINSNKYTALKIGVRKRGCSGLSYTMNYASESEKFDEVIEDKGIKIIIDQKALMFLVGTNMDYIEDDLKSEFVFKNPNAKGSCGCGESFHI